MPKIIIIRPKNSILPQRQSIQTIPRQKFFLNAIIFERTVLLMSTAVKMLAMRHICFEAYICRLQYINSCLASFYLSPTSTPPPLTAHLSVYDFWCLILHHKNIVIYILYLIGFSLKNTRHFLVALKPICN